jgi:methylisocitrate lyase
MTTKFKELLKKDGAMMLPGCYDCVTAKLTEREGFSALYITGYGLEASVLGSPDVGLLTLTEILERARLITNAVKIPALVDAETGFGGPVQVIRAVKEFEKTGVVGLHIEDQVMPKKCGAMKDKDVIPRAEMVAKIKAAVDARTDSDFIIIARTDSDFISIEEVIERCNLYLEAGADLVWPVTASFRSGATNEAHKRLAREIKGPLVGLRMLDFASMTVKEAGAAGYKIILYPNEALWASTEAVTNVLRELKAKETAKDYFKRSMASVRDEFTEFIGLPGIKEIEKKYAA